MKEKMTFQEKRTLVILYTLIGIMVLYSLFIYSNYSDRIIKNPNDFQFWGTVFIILIPVIIVSQIIIHIVFVILNKIITKEDAVTKMDERDKLIELKSYKISRFTYSIAFIMALGSQAFGFQPWVMFILLLISCFAGGIVQEIAKLVMYRKGF